jgi:hypothetical protein
MIEVPLADVALTGPSISNLVPKRIKWLKSWSAPQKAVVYTDQCISNVKNETSTTYAGSVGARKIALLIEPTHALEQGMRYAQRFVDEFDYVLTHERWIIRDIFPTKGLWYPIGGCWIPATDQRLDHPKSKMVSIIASKSAATAGHHIRHAAVAKFRDKLEVYGFAYRPIQFKTEALAPFMFSVVAENGRQDDYFTEKLIDSFVTGCVPIYFGPDGISKFFNMGGIIPFKSIEELASILPTLSSDLYLSMRHAVEDNFNRARKYMIAEDWVCEQYPFLFL